MSTTPSSTFRYSALPAVRRGLARPTAPGCESSASAAAAAAYRGGAEEPQTATAEQVGPAAATRKERSRGLRSALQSPSPRAQAAAGAQLLHRTRPTGSRGANGNPSSFGTWLKSGGGTGGVGGTNAARRPWRPADLVPGLAAQALRLTARLLTPDTQAKSAHWRRAGGGEAEPAWSSAVRRARLLTAKTSRPHIRWLRRQFRDGGDRPGAWMPGGGGGGAAATRQGPAVQAELAARTAVAVAVAADLGWL